MDTSYSLVSCEREKRGSVRPRAALPVPAHPPCARHWPCDTAGPAPLTLTPSGQWPLRKWVTRGAGKVHVCLCTRPARLPSPRAEQVRGNVTRCHQATGGLRPVSAVSPRALGAAPSSCEPSTEQEQRARLVTRLGREPGPLRAWLSRGPSRGGGRTAGHAHAFLPGPPRAKGDRSFSLGGREFRAGKEGGARREERPTHPRLVDGVVELSLHGDLAVGVRVHQGQAEAGVIATPGQETGGERSHFLGLGTPSSPFVSWHT